MKERGQRADAGRTPPVSGLMGDLRRAGTRWAAGLAAVEFVMARHRRLGWDDTLDREAITERLTRMRSLVVGREEVRSTEREFAAVGREKPAAV